MQYISSKMHPEFLIFYILPIVSALPVILYIPQQTGNFTYTYIIVHSSKDGANQHGGLPWAAAVSALVFLFMGSHFTREKGFTLKRKWLTIQSTDFIMS